MSHATRSLCCLFILRVATRTRTGRIRPAGPALAVLAALVLVLPPGASAQSNNPDPNPYLIDSPWQMGHRMPGAQASSPYAGPTSPTPTVQTRLFANDAGVEFGTSPWHVLSSKKYTDDPAARVIWGSSLKWLYKYRISGDTFEFVDDFQTNYLPGFVTFNFFGLAGDRIIMPDPNGLQTVFGACRGTQPALLEFRDGSTTGSDIQCVKKFELTESRIQAACGFSTLGFGTTGVNTQPLYSGDIAVTVQNASFDPPHAYVAIIDNALTQLKTCAFVDDSPPTNMAPSEKRSTTATAMYFASEGGLIKMVYDTASNTLTRVWKQTYPFRSGRTGTTPTLVGYGTSDQFAVVIDAKCAVQDVFTGEITCDLVDTSPSKLVAFERADTPGPIRTHDLPDYIDTVENSPSARGWDLVVCDYPGYTPDAPKNGNPDFAMGLAKVRWDTVARQWVTDWHTDAVQCSGVPSISEGANLVYFSGSNPIDDNTYQYAMRMNDDAGGQGGDVAISALVGPSSQYYDQGNNTVINDDGSIIWPSQFGLVRVFGADGGGGPVQVVLPGVAAEDGWVRESTETSNTGGGRGATDTGNTAIRLGDATSDRQYKAILSFDASAIPAAASVVSATLEIVRGGNAGTDPFAGGFGQGRIDIAGAFNGNPALENADFQAPAAASGVAVVSSMGGSGVVYAIPLGPAALAFVKGAGGRTQLRLRFDVDDNDDGGNDYAGFFSADNSNAANRPRLVVEYTE